MKTKMNYLILLLMTILMVGCTNLEDALSTDVETDPQETTTVETNQNSEKEEMTKPIKKSVPRNRAVIRLWSFSFLCTTKY